MRRRRHAELVFEGECGDGFGQRMFAAGLDGSAPGQNRMARRAPVGLQRHHLGLAFGQRAGLVEGHDLDPVRHFQRFSIFNQNAVLGCHAGADHDGRGRGQPQGAGAGNHQHGNGVENGGLPVTGKQAPAQQGDEGRHYDDRHKHGADLVHQPLDGRFFGLRRFHHPHNAGQR